MQPTKTVENAERLALAAAADSGVTIRELREMADCHAVDELYRQIWQPNPANPPITAELMRALAYCGNYLAGAFIDDELVGACVGFLAAPPGPSALHSHVTGVSSRARGRSVGFVLKLHQRAWALRRGLDRITWTFDPLVRRNAYFNIVKLAARPTRYLRDFYGPMDDALNRTDASDRLLLSWPIADPEVESACAGQRTDIVVDSAVVALDERDDRPKDPVVPGNAATLLVRTPADIERLRGQDPAAAQSWRSAIREVLGGLLDEGASVTGFTKDGMYVVRRRTE